MAQRRGGLKWLGISILAIAILLTAATISLLVVSGNRLRAEMGKSHVLTLHELASVTVPPEQNGAELYERVFTSVSLSRAENDFTRLKEGFFVSDETKRTPEAWELARRTVNTNRPLIPVIEAAAARRKCWFPVKWLHGPSAPFPHISRMWGVSTLLATTAIVDAQDGRMRDAIRLSELGFQVSESLRDEPTLIGQLTRMSMISTAARGLREVSQYGHIHEPDAKRLFDLLNTIDLARGYVRAMEGERAIGLWSFDKIRSDPSALPMWSGLGSSGTAITAMGCAWKPISRMDEAVYIEFMGKQIDAARYTYREAKAKGMFVDENTMPRYAIVSRRSFPCFYGAMCRRDAVTAEIIGTQIFLALGVYKDRCRSYPASLTELRTKLGWKLRNDPLTGKDLIYKRRADGFILYSVGVNMKDDGGKRAAKHTSTSSADDIVWKVDR